MAEQDQDQDENKSEKATPFKLAKAREKGVVARSVDLGFFLALLSFTGFLWVEGSSIRVKLALAARDALLAAPDVSLGAQALMTLIGRVIWSFLSPLVLFPTLVFAVVLVGELLQTGIVFSTAPLRLDFSRLNPSRALQRIFSLRLLIETAKNITKMGFYTAAAVLVLHYAWVSVLPAVTDSENLSDAMAAVALRLLAFFLVGAAAFAVLDQLIARTTFQKQMRMTRRDVRRELRDREGEPRLKQRRKQLHQQFAKLSKGIKNIRDADILITNPTHYAVALKYNATTMLAPMIVAHAQGHNAMRLRRLAFIYGVTVVQNPPLARSLYQHGRFERPIPEKFFRDVAELYIAARDRARREDGGPI